MDNFIFDLSVVLVGSAVLSYLAVLLKQPIIIAYILCGVLVGPWGFGVIKHVEFIEEISHIGIMLLLYLAGLCLHPQKLAGLFKSTMLITLGNCFVSFLLSFLFAVAFGFNAADSICIGLALMFSSTILVVKLLPTTKLHQQRMGALCIGILILQDLLAVGVMAFIQGKGTILTLGLMFLKMLLFIILLVLIERFFLRKIMAKVDMMHEVLFIFGLAWCFGMASVSKHIGLFYETGAFFAGVVLARSKIAFFISEKLKPLRDFFLVIFFFALGANLDLLLMMDVFLPAVLLAVLFAFLRPRIFQTAFHFSGETKKFSEEIGARLGQFSEFSLLIAVLAMELGQISSRAGQMIQLTTIITFIISSYFVVFNYPTPIGPTDKLIRD